MFLEGLVAPSSEGGWRGGGKMAPGQDWLRVFGLAVGILLSGAAVDPLAISRVAVLFVTLAPAEAVVAPSATAEAATAPSATATVVVDPCQTPPSADAAKATGDSLLPAGVNGQLKRDDELTGRLAERLDGLEGDYGVAAYNLTTGQAVAIRADEFFPSASLYKLLIMQTVYRAVQDGKLSLADPVSVNLNDVEDGEPAGGLFPGDTVTVAEALNKMITISSNNAAYALLSKVGGWPVVAQQAAALGLGNTTFGKCIFTTPADVLRLLDLMAAGRLVSPDASTAMLNTLLQQQVNDRLPKGLPEGTLIAHKTGELPGVRNDAGVVYAPGGPYLIVVLSQHVDEDEATQAISEISRIVYQHYGG